MGLTMEVFSGGQPGKDEGGNRVGSVRHDHGGAADAFFYKDGRKLDWSNKDDLPIFQDIVKRGKANGITGFGAGDGYMQAGSMHIGMGNPGVWGAKGKGDNAAPWLRSAWEGTPYDPATDPVTNTQVAKSVTAPSPTDDLQSKEIASANARLLDIDEPAKPEVETAKAEDKPLFNMPKILPDEIFGVNTAKAGKLLGNIGDMMGKNTDNMNKQVPKGGRIQNAPVQLSGAQQQTEMASADPQMQGLENLQPWELLQLMMKRGNRGGRLL